MPARNIYHDAVVRALTADGWTITAGVPREAIVLGFHPPDVRRYTDFAVGEESPAGMAAPVPEQEAP